MRDVKKKLFLAMMNVNILEGLRFYVSFACTFAFGELKLMEGSAKIISLIARDESQHLNITQKILKRWDQGDDPEMQEIAREEMDLLSDRMLSNTVIEDWSYELEETEETGIGNISNDNAGTSKHALFDA